MRKQRLHYVLAIFILAAGLTSLRAGTQALTRGVFVGQQASGYYGYSIANGDFNADGFGDVLVGAPLEYVAGAGSGTGRVYLYYGNERNEKSVDVIIAGTEEYEYLGKSISSAGDFNGDGFEDFIVGADGFNSSKGVAFIYFGGPQFDIYPDVRLEYSSASSFGIMVSKLGDVDGDGFDDVAVADANNVFVYFGNAAKSADRYQIISGYGNKIAYGGDVNGDGFEDILIGYPQTYGQAVVILGGAVWDGTPDVYFKASYSNDQFAACLAGGFDVNGDGYSDVVIGAEDDGTKGSGAGAAFLYLGGPDMINSNHTFGYAPSVTFYGDSAGAHLGHQVGFSADMDGDGFPEILAGENHFWYGGKPNRTFVFKGGRQLNAAPYRILHGEEDGSAYYFGSAFASADFNKDGYPEIFVGAYGQDKVYMFQNKPTATERIPDLVLKNLKNPDSYDFNRYFDANGDVNGDGYDDIVINASGDGNQTEIFLGGPNLDTQGDYLFDEVANSSSNRDVRFVGDVDGNGCDDFVSLYDATDLVILYFGDPELNFTSQKLSFTSGNWTGEASYGEFNGDGFSDVILKINHGSYDSLYIYLGGRYMDDQPDYKITKRTTNNKNSFIATDVNGDGFDDLLVIGYDSINQQYKLYVYYGTTDGLVYGYSIFASQFGNYDDIPYIVSAGDLNNDGYGDYMIRVYSANDDFYDWVVVYGQREAGADHFVVLPYKMSPPWYGYSGDLNGDGVDDLCLIDNRNWGKDLISVFTGSDPTFTRSDFSVDLASSYSKPAFGDLNGDGINDLVISDDNKMLDIFLSSPVNTAPRITAVKDVPADQGGKVTLTWFKSGLDGGRVHAYRVERSIAPAGNGFAWEVLTTVNAIRNNYYSFTAPTLNDAMEGFSGNTYFRVTALDDDGNIVGHSNIAYGHSVDNLAPAAVLNLSGSGSGSSVRLSWKANTESDLKEYRIYRSADGDVDVDTLEAYATVTDTAFTDANAPQQDSYYFVRAVDVHGNQGPAASWLYSVTGLAENSALPTEFKLEQNYPNPFNPTTTIRYHLARASRVVLTIYTLNGQKVAELVNQTQNAGSYQISFDASRLASGVYIYRLRTNSGFVQTRKMMLIR